MTEISQVYGQALYSLAAEESVADGVLKQLNDLQTAFDQEPDFLRLLQSENLPKAERCRIIDSSFRDRVHPYVMNFMKLLTEKGYIRYFSQCCGVYRRQYNEANGILPVTAVSATPLNMTQQQKLTDKLSAVTGKKVDLLCKVDPQCLGGLRLDFDGQRLDGTIRHRLDDLRGILKNTVL